MKRVAIIDFKMGNLFSVNQACIKVGLLPFITSDKKIVSECDAVILPGVGSFSEAMKNLLELDLVDVIKESIMKNKPFMGICLGFQLLFSESEEFGFTRGLSIYKGKVLKFRNQNSNSRIKIPQIGWNKIFPSNNHKWNNSLLEEINPGEFMYFVHSFYVETEDENIILSKTIYEGFEYCSSVQSNSLFASQFHPEKSAAEGIKIYKNFANLIYQGK